jgi:GTP cyclohydrolase II
MKDLPQNDELQKNNMNGINGDPDLLTMDRAVGELRRGRAIQIIDDGPRGMLVAVVETMQAPLLSRLESAGAGRVSLLLTAERARAAGICTQVSGPVAVSCRPGMDLDVLRALAGVSAADSVVRVQCTVDERPECTGLVVAGFQVAKAARLLPALVGLETENLADAGVMTVSVDDINRHSLFMRRSLKRASHARVPLADALDCEISLFRDEHSLGEHVAIVIGQPDSRAVVPVRLHSACLTGDLLASLRCDCGEQLRTAVSRIATLGGGVLLYLDQEGRGIGLPNKLRAYALQDGGLDTVDADQHLGFLSDERSYDVAAALLSELGFARIQLLTNNPQKISALREHGIDVVGRLPLIGSTNSHNARYLKAKLERAGHLAGEHST